MQCDTKISCFESATCKFNFEIWLLVVKFHFFIPMKRTEIVFRKSGFQVHNVTNMLWRPGAARTSWGSLQRSPNTPAGFWGALLLREAEGRGGERRAGKGRGKKGEGWEGMRTCTQRDFRKSAPMFGWQCFWNWSKGCRPGCQVRLQVLLLLLFNPQAQSLYINIVVILANAKDNIVFIIIANFCSVFL